MSIPVGYSWSSWEKQLLAKLDAPDTTANRRFLNAWAWKEGPATSARNNPFNASTPAPGSSAYNADGVQNYTTAGEGLGATYQTLTNGQYNDVVAALRSGKPSLTKNYKGLHSWSAGPNAPASKGYSNLQDVPYTSPAKPATLAGSTLTKAQKKTINATSIANAPGTPGPCEHSIHIKVIGTVCLDKPIALLAMGAGGLVMGGGIAVVLIAVAKDTGAGKAAVKAAGTIAPIGLAVRSASKAAAAQRPAQRAARRTASQQQSAADEAKRLAPVHAERRREETHAARLTARSQAQVHRAHRRTVKVYPGIGHEDDAEFRPPRRTRTRPLPDKPPF